MDLGTLHATLGANLAPLKGNLKKAESALSRYVQKTKSGLNSIKGSVFSLRSAFLSLGVAMAAKHFTETAAGVARGGDRICRIADLLA